MWNQSLCPLPQFPLCPLSAYTEGQCRKPLSFGCVGINLGFRTHSKSAELLVPRDMISCFQNNVK